ncbi:MAG: fatty acid desaturase [Bacteroidota bacterium]
MVSQSKTTTGKTIEKRRDDFYWVDDREPHFQRRKDILAKYPEVKKLFGVNPRLKYVTAFLVITQLVVAYFAHQMSWLPFLLVTYVVGATIASALFLAIHEITQNLAFKSKKHNNFLALFANLPIVFPYAISFKLYHAMHHWDQGKDGVDTDIPTVAEANTFKGVIGKMFWFVNQIFAYAFRPIFVKPIKLDKWQVYNIIFQLTAMAIILPLIGWSGLLFLLLSLFFAGSIHPTAGHFISEHYVFEEGQETYSYYGPLNMITFNVGYHNEHHDFPTIPGSRLPELRKMAPEYYDGLHSYNSWVGVIMGFLFNKEVTLFSRTKRK